MDYYTGLIQLFKNVKDASNGRLTEGQTGEWMLDGQPLGRSTTDYVHLAIYGGRSKEMLISLVGNTLTPLSEQGIALSEEAKQLLLDMGKDAFLVQEHFREWSEIVASLGEQEKLGGTPEAPAF